MLPTSHLTLPSRVSGGRWVITLLWLSGSLRSFLNCSLYSCHLFLISSALGTYHFYPLLCPAVWTSVMEWQGSNLFCCLNQLKPGLNMQNNSFQTFHNRLHKIGIPKWGETSELSLSWPQLIVCCCRLKCREEPEFGVLTTWRRQSLRGQEEPFC